MINEAKTLMRMFTRIERPSADLPRFDASSIVFPLNDAEVSSQGHGSNVMVPLPTEFESVFEHGPAEVLQVSEPIVDDPSKKIFPSPVKFSFEDDGKNDSLQLNHEEFDSTMPSLADMTPKEPPTADNAHTVCPTITCKQHSLLLQLPAKRKAEDAPKSFPKQRSPNFTASEIESKSTIIMHTPFCPLTHSALLRIYNIVRPQRSSDWELVCLVFERQALTHHSRTVDSIQRKWYTLRFGANRKCLVSFKHVSDRCAADARGELASALTEAAKTNTIIEHPLFEEPLLNPCADLLSEHYKRLAAFPKYPPIRRSSVPQHYPQAGQDEDVL